MGETIMGGLFSNGPSKSLLANNAVNEQLFQNIQNRSIQLQQQQEFQRQQDAFKQETASAVTSSVPSTPPSPVSIGAFASAASPGSPLLGNQTDGRAAFLGN